MFEILTSNQVILTFPIGTLKFTPNREELEYTDTTYLNLENKVEAMFTALEGAVAGKFANATSIWEAKRIYLSLFGKNIGDRDESDDDGLSDNAIHILDGGFYRLEELFKGKLFWNGTVIDSPHFNKMNQWDMATPNVVDPSRSPITPCLVSFTKRKSRVKRHNCTSAEHNRITPYNDVKVVVMDGRNLSLVTQVARYYLLRVDSNIRKVHVLRFASEAQKQAFFEHYKFDTAEFVNVSTILDDVKEWSKSVRHIYSKGDATAKLKYIDVESANACVKEEEVSLRDLEDGGVFVATDRKTVVSMNRSIEEVARIFKSLKNYFGEDIDRIYCIPEGKLEAKWFQKAKEEGLWVDLSDFIKENFEFVMTDEMKKKYYYHKFVDSNRHRGINDGWMEAISKKTPNSLFSDFMNEVVEPDDYTNVVSAMEAFKLGKPDFGKNNTNYAAMMKSIMDAYPLLQYLSVSSWESVTDDKLNKIVSYIESVDASKNLTTVENTVG